MSGPYRHGRRHAQGAALALLLAALPAPAGAGEDEGARAIGRPESLVASPAEIRLEGPRDARQLLLTGRYADGSERDLTHLASTSADDSAIVKVGAHGYVTPIADGRTTLVLRAGGREVRVPVAVDGLDRPSPVRFRREVVATFNTAGCNSGGCHGTPSGKNGFRLSLRGFDAAADYVQLTRDVSRRRVNPSAPDASLILMKGQGLVPHEGGRRLLLGGPAGRLIREWVAGSVRDDPPDLPALAGIEVAPALASCGRRRVGSSSR